MKQLLYLILFLPFLSESCRHDEQHVLVRREHYTFFLNKDGFRFGFMKPDQTPIVAAHPVSGISFSTPGGDFIFNLATNMRYTAINKWRNVQN